MFKYPARMQRYLSGIAKGGRVLCAAASCGLIAPSSTTARERFLTHLEFPESFAICSARRFHIFRTTWLQ